MRDHKGYEVKTSMDWRDKLILWTCVVVAIAALTGERSESELKA